MLSDQLTAKQGPLSRVWMASHWERKISKAQFLHTNLNTAIGNGPLSTAPLSTNILRFHNIDCIANNQTEEPITLRISGQLLLGVVRIHSRKTRYLLEDCNGALSKIKTAFKQGNVNLTETTHSKANIDSITLPERLDDFDILLPDTTPWSRTDQSSRDPLLDSLMTQDITLLDTQDNFLSFNEVMEQGRLLDQAEHQHIGDFGTLPMDDIEMGRRDNEAALQDRSFSADLNESAMNKLQINDDMMGQDDDGFEFDFGFDDNDDQMMRDQTPLPDFNLPSRTGGGDDNMDSLMEAGIVRMEEPGNIEFAMEDESSMQQEQPVRRRRRLVVDKVTEIPFEDLKRNILDSSSIVDKTVDDASPTTPRATKKLDLKKPIVCAEGSEVEAIVTRWNNNRQSGTVNANTSLMDGNSGFDHVNDDQFEFDFGFDDTNNNTNIPVMDQEPNIFDTDMSLMNEDDDTGNQSQLYDDLNSSTQQSTFGARTKETIETLQHKFQSPSPRKVIPFDELAPTTSTKKAEVARLFFDVLLLTSKNVIKVKQPTAYGPIQIRQ